MKHSNNYFAAKFICELAKNDVKYVTEEIAEKIDNFFEDGLFYPSEVFDQLDGLVYLDEYRGVKDLAFDLFDQYERLYD